MQGLALSRVYVVCTSRGTICEHMKTGLTAVVRWPTLRKSAPIAIFVEEWKMPRLSRVRMASLDVESHCARMRFSPRAPRA